MAERILLVEDERNVGSTLQERLIREGYGVVWAKTCEEARMHLSAERFQMVVLAVGLPDGSGFEVARELRQKDRTTALLFLTAYGTPEDRVHGLELGAEDYVVKPFHLKELVLRIQNGLKRSRLAASDLPSVGVPVGQAVFYFAGFEVEAAGGRQKLGTKECRLMRLLVERMGKVVSRDEILNHVWAENEYPTARTVDNFILKLRRWVEQDPENPKLIRSVRGVGYQLVSAEEAKSSEKESVS